MELRGVSVHSRRASDVDLCQHVDASSNDSSRMMVARALPRQLHKHHDHKQQLVHAIENKSLNFHLRLNAEKYLTSSSNHWMSHLHTTMHAIISIEPRQIG